MTNSQITSEARKQLEGKWLYAIIAFFLISIIPSIVISSFPFKIHLEDIQENFWQNQLYEHISFNYGFFISIIFSGSFAFGGAMFSLAVIRNQQAEIELIFAGFKDLNRFFVLLATYLIVAIFTFLWTLLLIIPGIMAALSYSMVYFIINDNPTIGSLEAIELSKKLTNGHKWQLFTLYLRFIALGFLCIFTLGIGFLWLIPYANVCLAKFYDQLIDYSTNQ
ncbi:MAG: hypothetical protein RI995_1987 [Bacteroidota bacterium]|jgi:uncharacterized membrane protein